MENQILKRLENNCITVTEICYKEDRHHRKQAFVKYIGKTSQL